jgi:O-antigen ligase
MDSSFSDTKDRFLPAVAVLCAVAVPLLTFGRITIAVALTLMLAGILAGGHARGGLRRLSEALRSPLGLMVVLTAATWLPGAAMSHFPLRSLEAVLRTPLMLGLALFIWAVLAPATELHDTARKAFIAACCLAAAYCLAALSFWPDLYWSLKFTTLRAEPVSNELKGVAALSLFTIPLLIFFACRVAGPWRIASLACCVALGWVVWRTYNRAAIAGFLFEIAFVGGFMLLHARSRRVGVLALFAIGATGLAVGWWLYTTRLSYQRIAPHEDWLFPVWLIDYERQMIWGHVYKIAVKFPWFGIGANTINFAPGSDAPIPGTHGLHIVPAHPHDWVVEILSETGWVGLLALLATIAASFILLARGYRRSGDAKYLAAVAVASGYWGSGLFNFSYWSAWWQLAFYISVFFCALAPTGNGNPAGRD